MITSRALQGMFETKLWTHDTIQFVWQKSCGKLRFAEAKVALPAGAMKPFWQIETCIQRKPHEKRNANEKK